MICQSLSMFMIGMDTKLELAKLIKDVHGYVNKDPHKSILLNPFWLFQCHGVFSTIDHIRY